MSHRRMDELFLLSKDNTLSTLGHLQLSLMNKESCDPVDGAGVSKADAISIDSSLLKTSRLKKN